MVKPNAIEAREYQVNILRTACANNTLVVLPTGLGKTAVAIMLAAQRLEKFPDSKILIVAPTRPLCEQHMRSFSESMEIPEEEIVLLTGKISPEIRKEIYLKAKIISATPQTIQNDLKTGKLNLENFSLLVVDEVHKAVKGYAYPFVCKVYNQQAKRGRILGLTASPGSDEARIKEICENLFATAVEIRSENDPDVEKYVEEKNLVQVRVELPQKMKYTQSSLRLCLRELLEKLKKYKVYAFSKKDLLLAQSRAQRNLHSNPMNFQIISIVAEALKVWHAAELIETQSVGATKKYFDELRKKSDKASIRLSQSAPFQNAVRNVEELALADEEHPKIAALKEIVSKEFSENKNVKIIIFSHYRENISRLLEILKNICSPISLIGQSGEKGLSQKEQIDVLKDFEAGVYNCLITSPIGEEGLHIASADIAIFYEPVASEIRTIQRRGRVGRTKLGKIIFLITKDTRDEANFYSASRKEKKMKEILKGMQAQKTIGNFKEI
ncbi:MAG TPA: DEAD/DEAH box helicase [archaeon]|nr:DEAD/DEAH box helicase [archaeon]